MTPRAAAGRVVAVPVVRGAFVVGGNLAPRHRTGDGNAAGLGVTLLVADDDAPRLAFATAAGVVTLALVPPEDAAPVPGG